MTLTELQSNLELQYEIDCYVTIEELEHVPSSTLYNLLIPHQKSAYKDRCRFVFFNFSPVEQHTLEHVFSTINYIDISPYFILVYTNQPNTVEFFQSRDITAINFGIDLAVATGNERPIFNIDQLMCAYAWAGLHVLPDGTVAPCCDYNGNISDRGKNYNIKTHTIKEIVQSDYMKDLRDQFRHKQIPTGCTKCFHLNDQNIASRQSLAPYKLENFYGKINWESDSSPIGYLGGHLGNLPRCPLGIWVIFAILNVGYVFHTIVLSLLLKNCL